MNVFQLQLQVAVMWSSYQVMLSNNEKATECNYDVTSYV